MPKQVLFIQGGGEGAHAIDADLAASLARLLGGEWRRPSRRNRSPGPCAELATMEDDACLCLQHRDKCDNKQEAEGEPERNACCSNDAVAFRKPSAIGNTNACARNAWAETLSRRW